MGSNNGPVGQGLDDVVARIDAVNVRSYSGAGNTILSLLGDTAFQSNSISFSSLGGASVFSFSGAGIITSLTNTGVSGAQSRTMSAWVRFGSKASHGVMSTGANGAGTGMALATSSTVFLLGYGNSGILTTVTYNSHTWYHLTYVSSLISGSTHNLQLFVNGGIAHSAVVSSINLTNSSLRIGCDNSGIGLSGQISRSNFYKKNLSTREIQKTFINYRSRYGL